MSPFFQRMCLHKAYFYRYETLSLSLSRMVSVSNGALQAEIVLNTRLYSLENQPDQRHFFIRAPSIRCPKSDRLRAWIAPAYSAAYSLPKQCLYIRPCVHIPSSCSHIFIRCYCTEWPFATPVPERPIAESHLAVGMGYGESKWVAERILHIASEKTPLRTISVRIGQLVGGDNGSWDTDQWLPAAVRGGEITGVIPRLSGVSTSPMLLVSP